MWSRLLLTKLTRKKKETNKQKIKTKIRIIAYLRRPKKSRVINTHRVYKKTKQNKTKKRWKHSENLVFLMAALKASFWSFRVSLLVLGLGFFNFIFYFANYPCCTFQTFPSPVLSLRNLVWNDCFYQGLISWKPKERISNEKAGIVFFFSCALLSGIWWYTICQDVKFDVGSLIFSVWMINKVGQITGLWQ